MPNLIRRHQIKIECHADVYHRVISINPQSLLYVYK